MGAGGAAIAGSVGQALANFLNLQQQRAQFRVEQQRLSQRGSSAEGGVTWVPSSTVRGLLGMMGVQVPEETPIPDVPLNALPTVLSGARPRNASQQNQPEIVPQQAVRGILGLMGVQVPESQPVPDVPLNALPTVLSALRPRAEGGGETEVTGQELSALMSGNVEAVQGIPASTANTLLQLALRPQVLATTTPEQRQRLGLPEQVPWDVRREAEQIVPSPPPESELVDYPAELVEAIPNLAGRKGTLDDIKKATDLATALVELGAKQDERERVARETAVKFAEWEGRFIDPDELREFLSKNYPGTRFFIPQPLAFGPYAGKIDFEAFKRQNEALVDIARTAAETGLVNARIRGEELQNELRRLDIAHYEPRFNAEMRRLAAAAGLDEARTSEIQTLLPTRLDLSKAELQELQQRIEQGEKLGPLILEKYQSDIERAKQEGRISQAEADYLNAIAPIRAGLMEIEFQRAQAEMEPINVDLWWALLGLPGQAPAGLKLRNYQFERFLEAVRARPGAAVKAKNLFEIAGIDTSEMPEEVLNSYIEIDSAGELANALERLSGIPSAPIETALDVAAALISAYTPSTTDDLLLLIFAKDNPNLARQIIGSRVDRMPSDVQPIVRALLQFATERVSGIVPMQVSPAPPRPEPRQQARTAENWAEIDARDILNAFGGNVQRAVAWAQRELPKQGWTPEQVQQVVQAIQRIGGGK